MDRDTLGFPFGTASRSYPSRHKSRYAEVFEDFEEMKGEDELRTVYPCPFCVDDFDLLELCCHIDLEHSLEPKSGLILETIKTVKLFNLYFMWIQEMITENNFSRQITYLSCLCGVGGDKHGGSHNSTTWKHN
ncbi:hypothetical protein Ahy_A06g027084 isoform A [Arachis hypogaea]|uniref:Di19 zinc-binding domain-containing protein n=1 Tax=Arachis hypogaea TaxID=3818 RepID=A0A445CMN9_ARAHY|nr:hypothetical protein Ahy_A06g027084 isoform A [Arachis hypogaea]